MVSVDAEELGGPSPSSAQPCHFLTLAPIKIPLRTVPFPGKREHGLQSFESVPESAIRSMRWDQPSAGAWLPGSVSCEAARLAQGWGGEGGIQVCSSPIYKKDSGLFNKALLSQPGHFLPQGKAPSFCLRNAMSLANSLGEGTRRGQGTAPRSLRLSYQNTKGGRGSMPEGSQASRSTQHETYTVGLVWTLGAWELPGLAAGPVPSTGWGLPTAARAL